MTRPADLDYIEELKARIERLEAALRAIDNICRDGDTQAAVWAISAVASAGLTPD